LHDIFAGIAVKICGFVFLLVSSLCPLRVPVWSSYRQSVPRTWDWTAATLCQRKFTSGSSALTLPLPLGWCVLMGDRCAPCFVWLEKYCVRWCVRTQFHIPCEAEWCSVNGLVCGETQGLRSACRWAFSDVSMSGDRHAQACRTRPKFSACALYNS